jgi:hypothetical protein
VKGINSNMVYLIPCKNVCKCKCHNVSPPNKCTPTKIKGKIALKRIKYLGINLTMEEKDFVFVCF